MKNQDLQSEALLGLFLEFGIGVNIYCQQLQHLIEDMASASAGCLIGRLWEEHLDFIYGAGEKRSALLVQSWFRFSDHNHLTDLVISS